MNILIAGGGNMGLTYAQSFLRTHVVEREQLMILEHLKEKVPHIKSMDIGSVHLNAADCVKKADVIILAVKPQDSPSLFEQIRPYITEGQVYLSIMAGIKIQKIIQELGVKKIIRAMPNLPAQIGQGMTAYTSTDEVSRIELAMIQNLLATTGKTLYLENEEGIDAVTALSGSGPAYVYFFMNAMIEAAQKMGFSVSESELMIVQTFTGALDLYSKSNISCNEWIKRVASRGGTTEAALLSFENNSVHNDIVAGAFAALNRAKELGK